MKPKTIISIGGQSELKAAVKKFAEAKPLPEMGRFYSYHNPTNLECLTGILFEIPDIREHEDPLLGDDVGIVDKEQRRFAWLVGTLHSLMQDRPIRLSSLAMLKKAPEIVLSVKTYYARKVGQSTEALEETKLALKKQLEKERTPDGLLDQHKQEARELFGRRAEDKITRLGDDSDYREEMATIDSMRHGSGTSLMLLGETEARRTLTSQYDALSREIRHYSIVLEGIEKLAEDSVALASAAKHNLHYQVRKLVPGNDDIAQQNPSKNL